jgi:hypothetical protein
VDGYQWADPTLCTECTIRDLVNHVTCKNFWTVPLREAATIEAVGDQFDGDVLGVDPIGSALAAASEAIKSVAAQLPPGDAQML